MERGSLGYRQLRAPADDLQSLVEPKPALWRDIWSDNRCRLAASARQCWAGMALGELRRAAREQLLANAHEHTRQYRSVGPIAHTADLAGANGDGAKDRKSVV